MRSSKHTEQLGIELATPWQSMPGHVQSILRMVHARLFDDTLNVKTLKADCGIGDHNISTLFKTHVGKSIKEYIEQHRMEMARSLLNRGVAVAEVASAVGYPYVQTFYRVFTRHYNRTPRDARERHLRAIGQSNLPETIASTQERMP